MIYNLLLCPFRFPRIDGLDHERENVFACLLVCLVALLSLFYVSASLLDDFLQHHS